MRIITLLLIGILALSCNTTDHHPIVDSQTPVLSKVLAEQLLDLPLKCVEQQLPYKSGIILADSSDLDLPIVHHPIFYGCFDWHSAVHGYWSMVFLLKSHPELSRKNEVLSIFNKHFTKENITQEIAYFNLNKYSASFERTYGWAWLLKLQEELDTWEIEQAKSYANTLRPLSNLIIKKYEDYLPKLVYPIRVGEHTNTAFGLSFALDYAVQSGNNVFANSVKEHAMRFYARDEDCPITWEPSGYDFLSPCLSELSLMKKVLSKDEFKSWSSAFLPSLFDNSLTLSPGEVKDRSDGKLVHLDGLNFSRAWCLYNLDQEYANQLADQHINHSLDKIKDGDYAGEHWLASFALYALKTSAQ